MQIIGGRIAEISHFLAFIRIALIPQLKLWAFSLFVCNNVKKKLSRFSRIDENNQTYNLSAYLIAQLGKNFNIEKSKRIAGDELLESAIRQVQLLQYQARGMVAFVEAENKQKLLAFYENYGFKQFNVRKSQNYDLIQLLRII